MAERCPIGLPNERPATHKPASVATKVAAVLALAFGEVVEDALSLTPAASPPLSLRDTWDAGLMTCIRVFEYIMRRTAPAGEVSVHSD